MNMLQAVLILGAFASAGWLLRLVWSRFEANDARWIIWIMQRQRGRRWLNYRVDDNIIPASLGYPILFHWALAKLPEKQWVRVGFILNAGFDIMLGAATFAAMAAMGSQEIAFVPAEARVAAACAAGVLVMFAPCLFPPTARLMAFNGRAVGLLLYFVFAVPLGCFAITGEWPWLFCSSVMFVIILLSSQFSFQACVATIIGLALAYRSPWYVVGPVGVTALAWMIRPVGVREPLRYFAGLAVWQYQNRWRNTTPAVRARWISALYKELFVLRRMDQVWRWLFVHSPHVLCVLYGPTYVALGVLAILDPQARSLMVENPIAQFCLAVPIIMAATALATSFQPLSIFGQAERYLEYGTPFSAALVCWLLLRNSQSMLQGGGWIALVFAGGLIVITINLLLTMSMRQRADSGSGTAGGTNFDQGRPSFLDWIKAGDGPIRILPVPMNRSVSLRTFMMQEPRWQLRTLYDWLSPDGEKPLAYMSRYMVGQHYTPQTLHAAFKEHDFNGVLVFKPEGCVWNGTTHTRDAKAMFGEFGDTLTLLGEDDRYALYWAENRVNAGAGN